MDFTAVQIIRPNNVHGHHFLVPKQLGFWQFLHHRICPATFRRCGHICLTSCITDRSRAEAASLALCSVPSWWRGRNWPHCPRMKCAVSVTQCYLLRYSDRAHGKIGNLRLYFATSTTHTIQRNLETLDISFVTNNRSCASGDVEVVFRAYRMSCSCYWNLCIRFCWCCSFWCASLVS